MGTGIRGSTSTLAVAVALCLALASTAGASAWVAQPSGTAAALRGVSCLSTSRCIAVGDGGLILATTDGGASWHAEPSTTATSLNGISCSSATQCWAVGDGGTVVATADGGATWSARQSSTNASLDGVSCLPGQSTCWAVGDSGTIVTTGDGSLWRPQLSGTINDLHGVACQASDKCWAVGANGTVLAMTSSGGVVTWGSQASGTSATLDGIYCADALDCGAVGDGGTFLITHHGGTDWSATALPSQTSNDLLALTCGPTHPQCWAVGAAGTVQTLTSTWSTQGPVGSQTLRAISCPADDQCWTVGDGGTILTGGVDGPPTNNSPPTIAGGAVDGSTLTASPGGWYGAKPIAFAYQWQECDSSGAGCAAIAGATAQTYAVASGDVGHTIRVAVTATNADGSGTATSAPTHVVALAKPFNWAPPTITGGPTQGHTLSAGDGGWSGSAPITYGYRWRDCDSSGASCTDIPGATAPSYTLTASDLGHTIHVVVRGTNGAGSVDATSAQTDAVWAPLPASGVIPTSESPLYTDGFTGNTQNLAIHSGPRLVTDGGSQYVAYYHPNASVPSGATIVLGKRALPNGSWSFYDTGFELSNRSTSDCPAGQRTCTDVHEVPALALDDQHRINLIWREGTSGEGPMDAQWARSTAPGDITTMSTHDGTSVGLPTDLAYPWLFEVSGSCTSPGTGANRCGLYLGYHTPGYPADGQLWLKRWDDARGAWVSPIKTPSGTEEPVVDGTCPASSTVPCTTYGQYYAVDTAPTDGVIRLVWTWDKSDGKSSWTPGSDGTTDLSYIQSADGGTTWQSASGATVATPITPGSLAAKQADLLPGQYVTCIDPVTADSTGDAHISFMLPAGGVYQPGDPSAPQTTWNYFHGWIDNGVFHHVQITTLTTPVGAPCGYGTMSGADIVASGQTVFGIMRPSSDAPWYLWRASSPYLQTSIYQLGTAYRGSEAPIVDHTGWEQTGTLMMLNDYLAPGSGSPSATATLSSVDGARLLQAP